MLFHFVCVFVFDPLPRLDVQADDQKFASAVAPGENASGGLPAERHAQVAEG